jgi:hypothetical protein
MSSQNNECPVNRSELGKNARNWVIDDEEIIVTGDHLNFQGSGLQSTPAGPSIISIYEGAENLHFRGGSFMLIGGNVVGDPHSSRNDQYMHTSTSAVHPQRAQGHAPQSFYPVPQYDSPGAAGFIGHGIPPPSIAYPFNQPHFPGFDTAMPRGYPTNAHTPRPKTSQPTSSTAPFAEDFPVEQDVKTWCLKHKLSEAEYRGLCKLGFRVGDQLEGLEQELWEWAELAPLHVKRIKAACANFESTSSTPRRQVISPLS